jgi:hypothetical protein
MAITLEPEQLSFVDEQQELTPADHWNMDVMQGAIDELFNLACKYRTGKSFQELVDFVSRFRFYKPYNGMLLHIQRPGATFVAPTHRWAEKYGRIVKPNANPLLILQPKGPVMFVFDVADTEPGPENRPLPPEVEKPFEVRGGKVGNQLERTIENAKRDGVRILLKKEGSQSAGSISPLEGKKSPLSLLFQTGKDKDGNPIYATIPVRYNIVLNEDLTREATYATMVHELAHLYCGHMGTPNRKWWPDRRGLAYVIREFEAESATYLLCKRLGIDNPSDQYLSCFMRQDQKVPPISLECVLKAAGLIEEMGRKRLKMRKDREVTPDVNSGHERLSHAATCLA